MPDVEGELEALRALVRTIDPAAVRAAAAQFRDVGEGIDASARVVGRGAAEVGEGWQGRGADAFGEYVRSFGTAGARDRQAGADAAGVLDGVVGLLEDVRREVEAQVAQATTLVATARQQALPGAADPGPQAASGPIAAARAAIARAEAQLGEAAARVRAVAGEVTGFATLPAPDTATMAPPDGRPLPWTPVEAESTTPAATGGGGGPDSGGTGGGTNSDGTGTGGGTGAGGAGTDAGAGAGTGAGTGAGAGAGPVGSPPPGQVGDWIQEAMEILAASGVPPEQMNPEDIARIIERESGGDPNAVNNWDSNAAKGTPSQGLMQTIAPTFEAHKLPGHDDIRNPVDNIIAGVRYAIERYGSVSQVPGVVAEAKGGAYVGY